jgi:hypothetical protein
MDQSPISAEVFITCFLPRSLTAADKVRYALDGPAVDALPADCRREVVWDEDGELHMHRAQLLDSVVSCRLARGLFHEAVQQLPSEHQACWAAVEYLVDSGHHIEAIAIGL